MPSSSTEPAGAAPAARMRAGARWVNVAVSVAAALVFFLLVEGLASVLWSGRASKRTQYMQEESHVRYDAELGWSNVPGLSVEAEYGEKKAFTTNAQGLRASENYDKAVPAGRFRIVALGDSFTMGYGVGDDETYAAQMQAHCPALQTVNMGQGGYGFDQDYLWYKRDGVKMDANLLLVAVIAHDFYRMASDNFIGYGKPVLKARDGTLVVENVPPPNWRFRTPLRRVREFVEGLAVVKLGRFLARSEAPPPAQFYGKVDAGVYAAAELALKDLAAVSKARGQHLAVVYLPTGDLLASEPTHEAQWLAAFTGGAGIAFLDLTPEFQRVPRAELAALFRVDSHYTEKGNRFVAEALASWLAEKTPGFPACGASARP